MIAPGTLCVLQNPAVKMKASFAFWRKINEAPDFVDENVLFLIIVIPLKIGGDNQHYAWGLLSDGRMGYVNCKWLVEAR